MEIMRLRLSLGDRFLDKIRIKKEDYSNPYLNTYTDS